MRSCPLSSVFAFFVMLVAAPCFVLGQTVQVGSTIGPPGDSVFVTISLATAGKDIAGVQYRIGYDPNTPIARRTDDGTPDCTVNPNISDAGVMELTSVFTPSGCAGETCTGILSILLPGFSNLITIPDGSSLCTCRIDIKSTAPDGAYPLTISDVRASDDYGKSVTASGSNGTVTVNTGCP